MLTISEGLILLLAMGVLILKVLQLLEDNFSGRPRPNIHRHPLKAMEENSEYKCSECLQMGLGKRLKCQKCKEYNTHPDCACPPTTVRHPFLNHCIFQFCSSGGKDDFCEACGKNTAGFFYLCRHCDKVLHLYCARLKPKLTTDDKQLFLLKENMTSKCSNCKLGMANKRRTWGYVSENGECQLHVYCVMKLVSEKMSKDGRREIIRRFKNGARRLMTVKLWITMAAAIASALLGNPIALVGLVQYILTN